MKKLIVVAALAAGVAYVVKFKSEQVKSAATKVTRDPRVQSTLATASEKVGPVASAVSSTVAERLHGSGDEPEKGAVEDSLDDFIGDEELNAPAVPEQAVEVAETDPVSAPEFTGFEPPKVESADIEPAGQAPEPVPSDAEEAAPDATRPAVTSDPLTDPLETLEDPDSNPGH